MCSFRIRPLAANPGYDSATWNTAYGMETSDVISITPDGTNERSRNFQEELAAVNTLENSNGQRWKSIGAFPSLIQADLTFRCKAEASEYFPSMLSTTASNLRLSARIVLR